MRTAIIIHRNEPEEIRREAHEALTYLPEGDVTSRSRVQIALGAAHAYSDEPQKAMQAFERARDLALRAKNPFLASVTLEQLAEPQIYHLGRLREATQNLLQILELGRANDGTMHPHAGTAHILLAEIQLEWNDLEKASEYLDAGFNLLNRGGIGYALTHCYCTEARYALAVDDSDRAVEAMRAAARAVQTSPLLHFQVRNLACQVKVALRLGDIEGASRWASGAMCDLPTSLPSDQREVWQIALARVSLARGEWQITIRTLSKVIAQAAHGRRMAIALEACLLKSLASRELGRDDEAIESLQMALSAAAPESYTLTFVEHGEPMIRLLVEASAREIMPDYVSGLIAAFPSAARNTAASQSQPLVEPLSPRELEVLHLIAQGLSNHEIAGRLFLALDTVKGHNYRIYGKLGVRRRTAAVSRARELGLV